MFRRLNALYDAFKTYHWKRNHSKFYDISGHKESVTLILVEIIAYIIMLNGFLLLQYFQLTLRYDMSNSINLTNNHWRLVICLKLKQRFCYKREIYKGSGHTRVSIFVFAYRPSTGTLVVSVFQNKKFKIEVIP